MSSSLQADRERVELGCFRAREQLVWVKRHKRTSRVWRSVNSSALLETEVKTGGGKKARVVGSEEKRRAGAQGGVVNGHGACFKEIGAFYRLKERS